MKASCRLEHMQSRSVLIQIPCFRKKVKEYSHTDYLRYNKPALWHFSNPSLNSLVVRLRGTRHKKDNMHIRSIQPKQTLSQEKRCQGRRKGGGSAGQGRGSIQFQRSPLRHELILRTKFNLLPDRTAHTYTN